MSWLYLVELGTEADSVETTRNLHVNKEHVKMVLFFARRTRGSGGLNVLPFLAAIVGRRIVFILVSRVLHF